MLASRRQLVLLTTQGAGSCLRTTGVPTYTPTRLSLCNPIARRVPRHRHSNTVGGQCKIVIQNQEIALGMDHALRSC